MRVRPSILCCLMLAAIVFFVAAGAWSRIMLPTSWADVQYLAERSPVVFRGQVSRIKNTNPNVNDGAERHGIATFQVDRIYKGTAPAELSFPFGYGSDVVEGHYCTDFEPDTYWLVFMNYWGSKLELADDCEGALPISSRLGRSLHGTDWRAQMEADFLAGLSDSDPAERLFSIQRLGGLKLPSSRPTLHRVIETGTHEESVWAVYAAMRTDDASVLPRVKELLVSGEPVAAQTGMAFDLQYVSNPDALPSLIAILESSHDELATSRILIALGQNLKDPRALPVLAEHLTDPIGNNRYRALEGMGRITDFPACIPTSDHDYDSRIIDCKKWWDSTGKFKKWPSP